MFDVDLVITLLYCGQCLVPLLVRDVLGVMINLNSIPQLEITAIINIVITQILSSNHNLWGS